MDQSRFLQAIRQGCVDPFGAARYWKDSPSPPPAPDYVGAANATAAGNLDAAKAATAANRVNQYSPYGSSIYTPPSDPSQPWTQNINLSSTGASLLDSMNRSQLGTAALENTATGRVADTIAKPFDINSPQAATDKAYANITSRLDPQWNQRTQQEETQLRNQGLAPGDEGYDNAMRDFNYGKNDAYTSANTTAMNFAPQTFQLGLAARNEPLNELNAIRTGSQVTNPAFGAVPQQQTTAGPNLSGAAQQQGAYDTNVYNQQVGSQNAFTGGLASIGASALGASKLPWWMAAGA